MSLLMVAMASASGYAADKEKGAILAQRWCASCHVVSDKQKVASESAPTFAEISAKRTIAQIKGALIASHTRMPDMALSRDEVDNLIVYLQTLAPPLDPWKATPEKDKAKRPVRG
ncbi:MAG: c-type cytochrome [Hyphomicrobiales bacterium]|nr:c-type cytochrome [Hyphomicrobiales bacterium]